MTEKQSEHEKAGKEEEEEHTRKNASDRPTGRPSDPGNRRMPHRSGGGEAGGRRVPRKGREEGRPTSFRLWARSCRKRTKERIGRGL